MKIPYKKSFSIIAVAIVAVVAIILAAVNQVNNSKVIDKEYYNHWFYIAAFRNDKVALLSRRTDKISSPKVDYISEPDKDSLAIFKSNMKYGYLNCKTGAVAIKPVFDKAWDFDVQSGLAAVVAKKKMGFIDRSGSFVISPQYAYDEQYCHEIFMFSEGYCIIPDGKGKIGVINTENRLILPATYTRIEKEFKGNKILVINEKYGLADSCYNIVIAPEFDYIALNHQGIIITDYETDSQYMLAYDYKTVVTPYVFDDIEKITINNECNDEDMENGSSSVKQSGFSKFTINNKCGAINDRSGKIIIPAKWDDIEFHSEGIFMTELNGGYFLVNVNGDILN
jgi:hypothetical protein